MKKCMNFNSATKLFYLFLGLYSLQVIIFWPGVLRPDSVGQLQQACVGMFSDHHPPLMAVCWAGLNFIYPGSGMMLMMHLFLLCSAAFIFALIFKDSSWRYFYGVSLFWPQIIFYSAFILKDIGFTFSFLCVASLLSLYSVRGEALPRGVAVLLSSLLFYGTAVKFQAAFLLPVMIYWLVSCEKKSLSFVQKGVRGGLLFAVIFGGVSLFNTMMTDKKDYSWQYVKLYDLVSIGLQEQKDLLPEFVKSPTFYSPQAIKERFNSERVDPLVFSIDSPLRKGQSEHERTILWWTWAQALLEHPRAYLRHRGELFYNLINKPLVKGPSSMTSDPALIPSKLKKLLFYAESWGVMTLLEKVTPFKFYLPVMIIYWLLGFWRRKKEIYASPLMFLNGVGLLLFAVLFMFSMASDGRYVYLSFCFFHFSHPFFFRTVIATWRACRRQKEV